YRSETNFFLQQIKTGKIDSIFFKDLLLEGEIILEEYFYHENNNGEQYFFFFEPTTNKITFLTLKDGKLQRKFSRSDIGNKRDFSIASDSFGNFYYPNKTGTYLIKIDNEGKLIQKIPQPHSAKNLYSPDNPYSVIISPTNTLYIISGNKVFNLKKGTGVLELHPINQYIATHAPSMSLYDILESPNGDLWISGNELGLFYFEQATGKIHNYQNKLKYMIPHHVSITKLVSDQTGVIWAIVQQLGVLKIIPQQSLFDNYVSGYECGSLCSFRGIVENDAGQIFASFYHGIFEIDPTTKTAQKLVPHLDKFAPFGLGYDNDYLLLNSGRRFHTTKRELDKNMPLIPGYNSDEGAMMKDNLGNWWNGQEQNLWFLDTKNKLPKWENRIKIPVKDGSTNCLHFGTKSNHIWVANMNRLFYVAPSSNTISKYFETPKGENIHAIFEDKHKNIWLGTEAGLVMVQPKNNHFQKYTTKDGLPHNFITGILSEGDSCLWLATNSGLSRFQISQKTFTNFYTEHGLSHNEFNRISSYKAKDGQMFFGGMRGINAFYPNEVMKKHQDQKNIGKVMLSSVSRVDENMDTILTTLLDINDKRLDFFHWDKSITFEFCLTDFRNGNKNQFSYLLEGYDKVWSNTSKYNFAKYSSLPSGDYVFRVKAFDAKGYWNTNQLAIQVKVYPPWWKTWWAYLSYLLITCGIFYGLYRIFKYRLELENQFKFEQKEAQRLKELDTFKSRLFTNLTHEFRTPLTVILGMSQQIARSTQVVKDEESLRKSVFSQSQLIEKNGGTLLQLINQLLDLSKLENNALKINLQNGDIIPFLNYTVSSFELYASQKNLVLKFSTPLDTLEMDFDPTLLQQVMVNLISNALKFTASGGKITVIAKSIQQEGKSLLQIRIQDTGIGIPSEKIPHIFDRFFQVDSSTTRAGEGTGIGLTHTKELVELMKGQIGVDSTIGEGTLFWIHLPVQQDYKNTGSKAVASIYSNKGLVTNFEMPKKRIDRVADKEQTSDLPQLLVIEDNPDVVTYLKSCLENQYQIQVAYNGKVGIEKAIEKIPDLILSDVMMPEKDGFEVCDYLKNDEKTSHIPIVLLTAKADFASKIDGLKRGADAYLSKPFDQEELATLLQSLLQKQQRLAQYFSKGIKNETSIQASTDLPKETIQIEHAFIQKIEKVLEKHYQEKDFTLKNLCQKIGLSRAQLFRKMKALVGTSPAAFIKSYRLHKAKILLETTELNVSEVAWKTGFSSLPHFSRVFQEEFGVSPSAVNNTAV
ncbi:MAG: ATP-binding protein, partial [Bacteroidota bacterium]